MTSRGFWLSCAGIMITAGLGPAQLKSPQLKKELQSAYTRWVNEDVAWIITDEEKAALGRLGTDEEREQFVEQPAA